MNAKWLVASVMLAFLPVSIQSQRAASKADILDRVKQSVVRVEVVILGLGPDGPLPARVENKPDARDFPCVKTRICIVGSGIFVNQDGDVVTASHVAVDAQKLIEQFVKLGMNARLAIGMSMPNFDNGHLVFTGTASETSTQKFIDREHDLAVITPENNPFRHPPNPAISTAKGGSLYTTMTVAKFSSGRPRDAEEVFACGFPLGEQAMVTTMGTIASAWKSEVPVVAKTATGGGRSIDIYQADIRINPGNSGGPLFRLSDQSVLGIIIEEGPLAGALANIVPAKYVADFLTKNGVHWDGIDAPKKSAH